MKSSGFDLVKAQTLSQVFFQTDRAHEQNNLNPMTLQRKLQKTLPIIYMCRPIKFFSSGLDHFDEFKTTNNGLFFFPCLSYFRFHRIYEVFSRSSQTTAEKPLPETIILGNMNQVKSREENEK